MVGHLYKPQEKRMLLKNHFKRLRKNKLKQNLKLLRIVNKRYLQVYKLEMNRRMMILIASKKKRKDLN